MHIKHIIFIALFGLFLSHSLYAQVSSADTIELDGDDLNIGGDIFSDFNEDIESHQMAEDERFFRYGRFFGFQFGLGITTFTGNRGSVYKNEHPTFNLSVNYFLDFQTAFSLGVAFSKHSFFFGEATQGISQGSFEDRSIGYGTIDVDMLRVFLGYRFYFDTHNLGTAITYSNPYVTTRLEYWYVTNKFTDQDSLADDSAGGLGGAFGAGLEFPIKLKESYLNVELLYNIVNFHDKNVNDYAPIGDSTVGVENLEGDAIDLTISYVWSW